MSDDNKFFRFVWRFNAIAIALVVLGFLLLSGGGLIYGLFTILPSERPQGHFAPVPNAAEAKNTYRLKSSGTVAFLKDGGGQEVYLVYSLGNWEGAPNTYTLRHIDESSSRLRESYNANLLLVNAETGDSRWLFSGYGRDITNWDPVIDPTKKDEVSVESIRPAVVVAPHSLYGDHRLVRALVFKVIEKDADHDGELTEKDGVTLYVWHLGDAAPAKLLDADLILSQEQTGKDRYVVSYESGAKAWIAVYSAPDFKLLAKKPLPKLPG